MLESVLLAKVPQQSLSGFIDSVASATAVPGGGSVAAIAGALAAALARMVAGLTLARQQYEPVHDEMRAVAHEAAVLCDRLQSLARRDAIAFAGVLDARRLARDAHAAPERGTIALQDALMQAVEVPLEVCRASVAVARLCETTVAHGNQHAITDSGVAAMLASAACAAASCNVRINVRSLANPSDGQRLAMESIELTRSAADIAARVARTVEAAL
jgi:formiminotetrahydrofolate cyclodeaminase